MCSPLQCFLEIWLILLIDHFWVRSRAKTESLITDVLIWIRMILGYKRNFKLYDPFIFCQIIAIHFVIFTRIKDFWIQIPENSTTAAEPKKRGKCLGLFLFLALSTSDIALFLYNSLICVNVWNCPFKQNKTCNFLKFINAIVDVFLIQLFIILKNIHIHPWYCRSKYVFCNTSVVYNRLGSWNFIEECTFSTDESHCISGPSIALYKLMLHISTFSFCCHEFAFQEHIIHGDKKYRTHQLFNKT